MMPACVAFFFSKLERDEILSLESPQYSIEAGQGLTRLPA
jgi:hypothetical protein